MNDSYAHQMEDASQRAEAPARITRMPCVGQQQGRLPPSRRWMGRRRHCGTCAAASVDLRTETFSLSIRASRRSCLRTVSRFMAYSIRGVATLILRPSISFQCHSMSSYANASPSRAMMSTE
jgi:hypothetical protein